MMLLEISDVRGGYGGADILHGVTLEVGEREIVTIAGTNGAGKSTLAKAVIGLLPKISGRIAFDGLDLARLQVEDRIAAGLAYVPQVANVFPSLTVLENLKVVPNVRDAAARLAAFARALLTNPKLVVVDEPTAALAPALVQQVFDLVTRLPAQGVAVLMVEQRARQALAISDRGCILDQGRVVLAGPAAGLLADDRMAQLYLGGAD